MKKLIWMATVFIFLIFIPPVLMIMMMLILIDVPMYYAVAFWLPIAVIGSLLMAFWYHRKGIISYQD